MEIIMRVSIILDLYSVKKVKEARLGTIRH